jgi:ATP-dependent protease HslVU (ClpYQ) peptidase subunit
MTVIAYKDGVLAADKRAENNGLAMTVTKIEKIKDALVGVSGNAAHTFALFSWVENGCVKDDYPEFQKTDDYSVILMITHKREIVRFERTPWPIHFHDLYHATGSGRNYAIAAMHMGATAIEAVEIACKFDINLRRDIHFLYCEVVTFEWDDMNYIPLIISFLGLLIAYILVVRDNKSKRN